MFIGGKIKCQRLKNCLTGKELSIKINISQQQLSRYETGASLIPLDKLLMLANVLNISVSYFFDEMGCDEE
ncbi:helix-turn-helix domain-containing protein [Morganella morganii]|uniref:helix-turn-helix domain-containing protein n=1 Tax=Morganella morganii TaxID=582 RepID=UPI00332313CF